MVQYGVIRVLPGRWSEEDFMERVSLMVMGRDADATEESKLPYIKDGGYKWALDRCNDWWGDVDKETGEFVVAYRYANCNAHLRMMEALERVILFMLHIDHYQKTENSNG